MAETEGIALNAPVQGPAGVLNLQAPLVTAAAGVSVDSFRLNGASQWRQVAATLPGFAARDFAVSDTAGFLRATGGAGTAASRYVVTDAFGLQGIGSAGYAGAHYALGADIAASGTAGWNLGEGFRPIGNRGTPFSGSLDGATAAGGRHAISGLAQVVSSGPGGLFGIIAGATIQNLRLLDIALEARQSFAPVAGGLVGETQAGAAPNVIENVLVTGRIAAEMGEDSVSSASFGGLVGLFGDGRIADARVDPGEDLLFPGHAAGLPEPERQQDGASGKSEQQRGEEAAHHGGSVRFRSAAGRQAGARAMGETRKARNPAVPRLIPMSRGEGQAPSSPKAAQRPQT